MESKKLEYDSTLGGPVVLGSHMPTYKYAASALKEIKELVRASKQTTSTKLVFQTLPKHMRRRAMSHHPKRLPRKYRMAHISQMSKSGKPQLTKRPSRKHRRRPGNLLKDYLRRQRKHKWLETHIWHAKRFHMIDKWGYKLPYASCDKTYRACYRATAEHCLLQDISFHSCIELRGDVSWLKEGFDRLTSKDCGLSITAKTFITGRREGCVDLFKDGCYPCKALGKAQFVWRCEDDEVEVNPTTRTLWLWLHPASYAVVLEELIKVFNLKSQKSIKVLLNQEEMENTDNEKGNSNSSLDKHCEKVNTGTIRSQRRLQFMTKTTTRYNLPIYRNENSLIELKELRGTLNRFRLTGPLAQAVLQKAFIPKDIETLEAKDQSWLCKLSDYNSFREFHEKQHQFWIKCCKTITSPGELLSNMVLALNINDPRMSRPHKRTKAVIAVPKDTYFASNDILDDIKPHLSSSPLWCEDIRNFISDNILSTHSYCSLREKHAIVPGKPCKFEAALQPVPILLIQRPGSQSTKYKRLSYGCGWDIIAPAGYGMSIWLSLIMWGARPGGLREFESIAREMGTEEHLPDTVGGLQTSGQRYNELYNKYFRLPPAKRCNYGKYAIVSPFRVPFLQLIRDWDKTSTTSSSTASEFFVLRNREKLQDLADSVKKCNLLNYYPTTLPANCLVQIKITLSSRGNPGDFSLICLPNRKDFKKKLRQIKNHTHNPIYEEPLLPDPNEKERKQLRTEHKKLLKRLRAQRVREKRKKQETSTTKVFIRPPGTSTLCSEQLKKMCKLWLPEDMQTLFTVRKQSTRDCFGYVSTAQFCLTEGMVGGIGYATIEGLKQLIKLCQQCHIKQPQCLIRSTKSRFYRFATIKVNTDI